jgi:hypothetical protein
LRFGSCGKGSLRLFLRNFFSIARCLKRCQIYTQFGGKFGGKFRINCSCFFGSYALFNGTFLNRLLFCWFGIGIERN